MPGSKKSLRRLPKSVAVTARRPTIKKSPKPAAVRIARHLVAENNLQEIPKSVDITMRIPSKAVATSYENSPVLPTTTERAPMMLHRLTTHTVTQKSMGKMSPIVPTGLSPRIYRRMYHPAHPKPATSPKKQAKKTTDVSCKTMLMKTTRTKRVQEFQRMGTLFLGNQSMEASLTASRFTLSSTDKRNSPIIFNTATLKVIPFPNEDSLTTFGLSMEGHEGLVMLRAVTFPDKMQWISILLSNILAAILQKRERNDMEEEPEVKYIISQDQLRKSCTPTSSAASTAKSGAASTANTASSYTIYNKELDRRITLPDASALTISSSSSSASSSS